MVVDDSLNCQLNIFKPTSEKGKKMEMQIVPLQKKKKKSLQHQINSGLHICILGLRCF